MIDNINIYYNGDDEIANAVDSFENYIKKETLAVSIEDLETFDLNEHEIGIRLEKVK